MKRFIVQFLFLILLMPVCRAASPDEFSYLEALGRFKEAALLRMNKVKTYAGTKTTAVQKSVSNMIGKVSTKFGTSLSSAPAAPAAQAPGASAAAPVPTASASSGGSGVAKINTGKAAGASSGPKASQAPIQKFTAPVMTAGRAIGRAVGATNRAMGRVNTAVSNKMTIVSNKIATASGPTGRVIRAVGRAPQVFNNKMTALNKAVVSGVSAKTPKIIKKALEKAGKINEAGKQAMIKANTALVNNSLGLMGKALSPLANKALPAPGANAHKPVTKAERTLQLLTRAKLHEPLQLLAWKHKRALAEVAAAKKAGNWERVDFALKNLHHIESIARQREMRAEEGGTMSQFGNKVAARNKPERKQERLATLNEARSALEAIPLRTPEQQKALDYVNQKLGKGVAKEQTAYDRAVSLKDAATVTTAESLRDATVTFRGTKSIEKMYLEAKMDLKVAKENNRPDRAQIALERIERINAHLGGRRTAVHGLEDGVTLMTPKEVAQERSDVAIMALKRTDLKPAERAKYQSMEQSAAKELAAIAQAEVVQGSTQHTVMRPPDADESSAPAVVPDPVTPPSVVIDPALAPVVDAVGASAEGVV